MISDISTKQILFPLLLLILATSSATAQDGIERVEYEETWRIGGFVGVGLLDYNAGFSELPGVPSCCPGYEDGSGFAFGFGGAFGLPLTEQLRLGSRLLFTFSDGSLEAEDQKLVTREQDTVTATFGYSLELSRPMIGLEALVDYAPVEDLDLGLFVGGAFDLSIGSRFRQQERIVAPEDIRYGDDRRVRNVETGDLPNEQKTNVALFGGLRYEIPLVQDRSIVVTPELIYRQGLSDMASGLDWTSSTIRLGVTLSWLSLRMMETPSPLDPGETLPSDP